MRRFVYLQTTNLKKWQEHAAIFEGLFFTPLTFFSSPPLLLLIPSSPSSHSLSLMLFFSLQGCTALKCFAFLWA